MMMDIFSSFDPATAALYPRSSLLFWATSLVIFLLTSPGLWAPPTKGFFLAHLPLSLMSAQIKQTKMYKISSSSLVVPPLFLMLIAMNLSTLFPYVFSPPAHLFFTLSLALPIWAALLLSSATHSPYQFSASLLPSGAPLWLNPFLLIVEIISTSLRPLTLSIRLAANMSTGHVIVTLMALYGTVFMLNTALVPVSLIFFCQVFYLLFEMGVCLVQAYIFCLLGSLYSEEHTS